MRIKVEAPELVDELLRLLATDARVVARRSDVDEVDTYVADGGPDAAVILLLLVGAWEAAHPRVPLEPE